MGVFDGGAAAGFQAPTGIPQPVRPLVPGSKPSWWSWVVLVGVGCWPRGCGLRAAGMDTMDTMEQVSVISSLFSYLYSFRTIIMEQEAVDEDSPLGLCTQGYLIHLLSLRCTWKAGGSCSWHLTQRFHCCSTHQSSTACSVLRRPDGPHEPD